jgi:O-antigen/teichoic acid export membrane protein
MLQKHGLDAMGRYYKVYENVQRYWKEQKRAIVAASCLLFCTSFVCALIQSQLITLIVFIVVAVALLSIARPVLALLVVGACAGLPALVLPIPGHHMHLVEPAVGLCLLTVFLRRPRTHFSAPHLFALAFLILAFISFAHVPEVAGSTQGSDTYGADKRLMALCIVFSAFFCSTLLAPYVRDSTHFLIGLLFVSLPPYLVGLAEFLGVPLAAGLEASGANNPVLSEGRLWGPFSWSVNFGMYLVNLFAVALVCWLLGSRRWQRIVGAVMTLATALSIIGTGTRSAVVGAGIIALLALAITRRFKLLGCSLLLMTIAGAFFSERIAVFFTHDETSTSNRLLIWNLALKLIWANPWLGIGLQQFHYYYAQLIVSRANELGAMGIHPHEQYLEWAMESGLPWLLTGILVLLGIIVCCIQAYYAAPDRQKASHSPRALLLAATLAMVANVLIGFFDAPLDQLEGPVVLFLLAGLALGSRPFVEDGKATKALSVAFSWTKQSVNGTLNTWRRDEKAAFLRLRDRTEFAEGARLDHASTGRAIVFQLLSWGIALPLIFPTTALLAHYLGPAQYGEYSLTFPFLTIFALLSGTGMDPLVIRQLSNRPRAAWGSILSYALGSRLLSTVTCSVLAALVACLLPIPTEQRNLLLIGCTTLLFSFSFNGARIILSHGFRAEQRVGPLALLEAANRILTAALIALVVLLHLSLLWIYVLVVYSDLPAFLLQLWLACGRYGIRLRFSLLHLREHMLSGLPLLGHRALTLIAGQIDLLVLTVESTPVNVGIYALASRITDPLISIAHVYVNGLYPLFCTSFQEDSRRFANLYLEAVRVLLLLSLPCALIVTMAAGSIVEVLGGQQFAAAIPAVQILMWTMILTFLNQLAESACTAAHLERRIPLVTAASTALNLVANLLLIPRWQILGASLAAFSSESVTLCLFTLLLRAYIRPLPLLGMALSILVSNLPAFTLLRWQYQTPFIATVPLGILLVSVSYVITGIVVRRDISKMLQLLSHAKSGP